jgi:hypothetical protein
MCGNQPDTKRQMLKCAEQAKGAGRRQRPYGRSPPRAGSEERRQRTFRRGFQGCRTAAISGHREQCGTRELGLVQLVAQPALSEVARRMYAERAGRPSLNLLVAICVCDIGERHPRVDLGSNFNERNQVL